MAMKKTFGGDSPLRQGAEKSFWTLPIFGSTAAVDRDVFWKSDPVFRFFPSGVLIGEGAASKVDQGARASPRPCRPMVWPPSGLAPSPLRSSRSSVKYLDVWLLFCPIPRIFPM
jgi:hypothetical protein